MNPDYHMRFIVCFILGASVIGSLIVLTARAQPPLPFELDLDRAMRAIVEVENTPRYIIGKAGERSEFQLTETVWKFYSKKPFWWASRDRPECKAETVRVVRAHLKWIEKIISAKHPTRLSLYSVFATYKAGWTRFNHNTLRAQDVDYALRALNLYNSR